MLPLICFVFQTNHPLICCRLSAFFFMSPAKKKKPFQLPVFCIVHFHLQLLSHRTGVNSHLYGHIYRHSNHPYGSFLPTSTSFLSPCNPSKYVQDTSRPWKNLPEQFFHAQKFPYGRFGASHHALPPNCNRTSFRSRAEILSFPVFSRTVSNTLPYGNAANLTGKHRTVLASRNVHPYGVHKQTTFWTLRSRVLQL